MISTTFHDSQFYGIEKEEEKEEEGMTIISHDM